MGGPIPPWPEPDPDDDGARRARIVSLELTSRCNLGCTHCYAASGQGEDLPVPEVERRLDLARGAGAELVILTGGEPLVHEGFDLALDAASRLGLETVMRCNGVLVTRAVARRLKRHGMPLVGISIEGGRARTNDAVRGAGHLAAALSAVETLRSEGLFVTIEVTLHAGGAAEVPEVARLARDSGASAVIFRRLVPMGRASAQPQMVPSEAELAEARRTVRALDPEGAWLHVGCNLGGRCVATDYLHVDLHGDVHPCYLVRDRLAGIDELPARIDDLLTDRVRHRRACVALRPATRAA